MEKKIKIKKTKIDNEKIKNKEKQSSNKKHKTLIKNQLSNFDKLSNYLSKGIPNVMEEVKKFISLSQSVLDKAVKKGVIHKNNASRKKSKISKKISQLIKSKKN